MRVRAGAVLTGVVVLVSAGQAAADVIHLTNGRQIEVEAWRDAGDAVEFASGGGIVRIFKGEIRRIEGRAARGDLRMYSAPPSAAAPVREESEALRQMGDLLQQGEGLFAQAVLSAEEKASAFRRLGERWRALSVPERWREAHARGQQAIQLAEDAYTAEAQGTAPDARERVEAARKEMEEARGALRRLGEEQG